MAVLLPIIVCCGGAMLLAALGGFSALSLFSEALKQRPMRLLWRPRSANGPDHELIWLAVSVAVIAGGAAWLALSCRGRDVPFSP